MCKLAIAFAVAITASSLSGSALALPEDGYPRPPKKILIVQEAGPTSLRFPWIEASSVLAFLASILSLAKEVITK